MGLDNKIVWLLCVCGIALSGCGSVGQIKDSGPAKPVDVSHIPDAVPRVEQRTRAGNKSPYTVLGKTYRVMPDSRDFEQTGDASWYGKKFHGRRTANGEIYDMYGMTAAHKSIPIPSYVEVMNRNNGRRVVVRVNDRGPFHGGRIIDLTYSAAKKLGFIGQGTAPVSIRVLEPGESTQGSVTALPSSSSPQKPSVSVNTDVLTSNEIEPPAPAPVNSEGYQLPSNTFLQAGAFGSEAAAQALSQRISTLTAFPVLVSVLTKADTLYRVRIGPIVNNWELMNLRELLQKNYLGKAHVVYD